MPRNIELKVGLFITVMVLLILVAAGYVGHRKGLFSRDFTYTLSSATGENLTEGMPVVFWGFKIGRVSAMELTGRGVLIRIKIPEEHNHVIRADSKFVLDKPLIGSPRLIVSTGNLNGPPLSPRFIPEIAFSNDINELFKQVLPIAQKMDLIAANVSRISGNLADPEGDISRILRNAQRVTARFAQKESLLEMAMGNSRSVQSVEEILGRLQEMTQRIDSILRKVEIIAEKGDRELYGHEGMLPQVREVLRNLLGKLSKLDGALENVGKAADNTADATKDLKSFRGDLEATITAIGHLAEELDRKIPFKTKPEILLP